MLKKTTRGMTAAMTRRGVGFATGGGGPSYDTDAQAYITLVEAADSQSLETGVKDAINAFVAGCKSDGIWDAIKAACIMAGARTLTGALQPLVGTAPTNNNFVSGDYDRKLGLEGDGATKYLDSNRASNDDPQNDSHHSIYVQTAGTSGVSRTHIGTNYTVSAADLNGILALSDGRLIVTSRNAYGTSGQNIFNGASETTGFLGASRSISSSFELRFAGTNYTANMISYTPSSANFTIFARNQTPPSLFSDGRLSFYSIGEALDLALLDSRVSTLMAAIGAAIP